MQYGTRRTTRRSGAEASIDLRIRRRWFDGEADAATQTDTPPASGGTPSGDGERRFTQAELDHQLAQRAKRAAQAEQKRILEDLGAKTLDEIKAKLSAPPDTSAIDTLSDQIAKLQAERDEALKQRDEADRFRRLDKRNAVIEKHAAALKADDPADVMMWLEKNKPTDLDAVFDESGAVVEDKIKTLIEAVRTAKPAWFKTPPGTPSNGNGVPPRNPTPKQPADGEQRLFRL